MLKRSYSKNTYKEIGNSKGTPRALQGHSKVTTRALEGNLSTWALVHSRELGT